MVVPIVTFNGKTGITCSQHAAKHVQEHTSLVNSFVWLDTLRTIKQAHACNTGSVLNYLFESMMNL